MRLILGSHTAIGLADADTGTVSARRELVQPTYVTVSAAADRLYAVGEDPDGPGRLYALGLTAAGFAERLVDVDSGDTGPCHVSLDPRGEHLLLSHYTGGSLGVLPIRDTVIGEPVLARHHGTGPDPDRQEAAHVHQAVTDPGGAWVLVCDLGTDEVVVYRLVDGEPRRHGVAAFPPGHGVRHLAFAPDGRRAYVAAELSSQLVACDWDPDTGVLTPGKSVDTTEHTASRNYPGAVLVSPDGQHVYVTNRGEDAVAVFDTGSLTRLATVPTGGAWPRDACLSPDGTRLFVANERGGTVTGFRIEAGTPVADGFTVDFPGVTSVLALA